MPKSMAADGKDWLDRAIYGFSKSAQPRKRRADPQIAVVKAHTP